MLHLESIWSVQYFFLNPAKGEKVGLIQRANPVNQNAQNPHYNGGAEEEQRAGQGQIPAALINKPSELYI